MKTKFSSRCLWPAGIGAAWQLASVAVDPAVAAVASESPEASPAVIRQAATVGRAESARRDIRHVSDPVTALSVRQQTAGDPVTPRLMLRLNSDGRETTAGKRRQGNPPDRRSNAGEVTGLRRDTPQNSN